MKMVSVMDRKGNELLDHGRIQIAYGEELGAIEADYFTLDITTTLSATPPPRRW